MVKTFKNLFPQNQLTIDLETCSITISDISKATGPIVTNFYIERPIKLIFIFYIENDMLSVLIRIASMRQF